MGIHLLRFRAVDSFFSFVRVKPSTNERNHETEVYFKTGGCDNNVLLCKPNNNIF